MEYCTSLSSPLGKLTLASDGTNLTGLWIAGQKYHGAALGMEKRDLPVFAEAAQWLTIYFSGRNPNFMPPLAASGSSFQEAVWKLLRAIPYGQTITYGQIASELAAQSGKRVSAQAVGGAVGHNPISILIPCHRVVGANGNLTGYAGGIEKKCQLLQLEGLDLSRFTLPKK